MSDTLLVTDASDVPYISRADCARAAAVALASADTGDVQKLTGTAPQKFDAWLAANKPALSTL